MPPKGKAGAKSKSSHKLAELDAEGLVFTDFAKKQWRVGKPIGSGGFGMIYLCTDEPCNAAGIKEAEYIIKIEPHENGPLFCELHYYQRVAKPELIEEWKKSHQQQHLGVPRFVASGVYEDSQATKYRFMVMERFGTDLQKLFEKNGHSFPLKTVLLLGMQMLDVLEYIHGHDYVHADIKASNILLANGRAQSRYVYLVDYGLASKYCTDGVHKKYLEDPRKAHDGTVEFTSRDAHKGVSPARRGDLEILGYCLLQWCAGKLPWEDKLQDKNWVKDQKTAFMNNVSSLLSACKIGSASGGLAEYMTYVSKLGYDATPNYDYLRSLFNSDLQKLGLPDDTTLVFIKPAKKGVRRISDQSTTSPRSPRAKRVAEAVVVKRDASKVASSRGKKPSAVAVLVSSNPETSAKNDNLSPSPSSVKRRKLGVKITKSLAIPSADEEWNNGRISETPIGSEESASYADSMNGQHVRRARHPKLLTSSSTQTSPSLKGLKKKPKP